MEPSSHPLPFVYIQPEWDKLDNSMVFTTPLAHSSSSGTFVPQPLNCSASVSRMMTCASSHYVANNDILWSNCSCNIESPFRFPPNMLGLYNPCPSSKGWTDWIDGDHKSVLQCSESKAPLSINDPIYPTFPSDHGYDAQAYHQRSDPSNDLKHSLSASSVSTQASDFLTSHPDSHTIRCLPSSGIGVVDTYLERKNVSGKKKWTCHYTGCKSSSSWRNKDAARNHVNKHLNQTKMFVCVECDVYFASKKNAIRHCAHQGRSFPCSNCSRLFTRVDYRNKHQKSCGRRA